MSGRPRFATSLHPETVGHHQAARDDRVRRLLLAALRAEIWQALVERTASYACPAVAHRSAGHLLQRAYSSIPPTAPSVWQRDVCLISRHV